MIIGFLGKGGSGKSTLSFLFTHYASERFKKVLAIDADHNMDLTFQFDPNWNGPYFGSSLTDIKKRVGFEDDVRTGDVFLSGGENIKDTFSLEPADPYTKEYSKPVAEKVLLMSAGPHTDAILHDESCSHVLTTSLKIYLPLLALGKDEFVIVDEKAGADGAGTGVSSGLDLAVIVSEPTVQGTKVAKQIASLLDFYGTPHVFLGNKVLDKEDEGFLRKNLDSDILIFNFDQKWLRPSTSHLTDFKKSSQKTMEKIIERAKEKPSDRFERSRKKFERNRSRIPTKTSEQN